MRLLASHTALAMAVITIAGNVALAQQAKKLPVPAGTSLERGVKYSSPSGNHFLKFASDGNLVITTKQDGFVWGLNEVAPGKFSKTSRVELTREGRLGAFDAQGNTVWSPAYGPDRTANLNLTFEGTLQVVAGNGTILWSSNGVLTRPMSVFRNKAALTEDRSQLASEKGWSQCWVMTDPAIRIFATNRVSSSAINAVANIYVEMLHNLDPNYSRSQFDGFRVYITNGESGAELKKLNTVGTMWTDGTHEKSREFLRGGASQDFLWISEQMICKTGVKTRAAIGKRVSELGYSRAEIDETKWTRLVLTFDLTSRGGDAIVYADGKLLHKYPSDLAVDSRFSLGNGVLFFADDSGDNGQLSVNALAIYSGVLSPQQVAALGAAGTPIAANTNRVAAKPQPVRLKLPARFIMKTYGVGGKGGVGAADGYFVGVQRGKSAIIHAPQEAAQANKSGIKTISREELAGDLVALKTDAGYLPNLSSTIGPANKYMVVESFVPDRGNKRLFTLQLVDSSPTQYLRHGGLIIYNDIRQHVEKTGQPAKVFEQDVTWQYTESP